MVYIPPKNVLVEFIRGVLTDPRARAEDSHTDTFDGGGTTFTLTPSTGKMSCITSVVISSIVQTKWKDYYVDWQNQKVIFYSATTAGSGNVVITYKQGTSNWIYWDKAKVSLSALSFPRINILVVSGSGTRLGQYNSDFETSIRFQIDIWTKENQVFTINSMKYEGEQLAEYLAYQITQSFRQNEANNYPILYNYELLSTPRDLPFDVEMECHHKIVEVGAKGLNVAE